MIRGVVASVRLQEADTADVIQLTWLRAFERIGSVHHPDRLGGWLASVANRECLGLLRRARWETPDEDVSHDRADGEPSPEDVVLAQEACTAVRAAVAALTRRRREFVHALFYRPDANYVTVAGELSMPVGSIGPTRGRVLQSLRCALEPAGYRGSELGGRTDSVGPTPGLVA